MVCSRFTLVLRVERIDGHAKLTQCLGPGDVIFFNLFRTPTLVLNSLTAARDLLDKRSAKYSDRPRMVLMCEM